MYSSQNSFTASHETEKFLCDRLRDQNQPILARYGALLSLRNLRGPGPRNAPITATSDSSNLLAYEAALALSQMQDVDAIPSSKAVRNDLSLRLNVPHEAAEALGAIGLETNIPPLWNSLIFDTAQEVQEAYEKVKSFQSVLSRQRKNAAQAGSIAPAPKRARVVVQTRPEVSVVNPAQPISLDQAGSSRGKGKEVEAGALTASQEMMPPPTGRTEDTPAAALPDLCDDLKSTTVKFLDSIMREHDRMIDNTPVVELRIHAMQTVLLMRGMLEKYGQLQRDWRKGRQEVAKMKDEVAKAEKTNVGLTVELEALRKVVEEKDAELVQKGIELGEIASKAVQEYKESGELQEQFMQECAYGFEALRSAAAAEYPDRDFSRFQMVDDQATSSQVPTSEGRNVDEEVSSYLADAADPQLPTV